ncbi:putative polysaccharide biosynthesis protein [Paenibacillus beijingensis]|uniref:Membrane protein n=1 Tax=Paenibacillus beijingensis TaxID=1126833 RepID=A0A0D5NKV1_9BACL|nr:polysaccharide biosynthesis protein [Paenibacillus beijingensis]AJY75750.1 membrane protein [Paenibacillus beijingensis]
MVKKDSLIKGTLILAAAALVARFLGIFQRVPLDYMVGDDGDVYFAVANTVYMYLLIIATAGIPSAISKMVSERYALGRPAEAQQIYRAALIFGAVTGIVLAALLYALAPLYSSFIAKTPGADISVRAIAPALLLFPVIAMMRGYFQGRQMMAAGGISQIVEQIMRVVLGIGIALIVLNWGWGDRWIAAAATFGSVFGSIGAFAVMLWYGRKLKRMDAAEAALARRDTSSAAPDASAAAVESAAAAKTEQRVKLPFRSIYKEIFSMSLPVVVTAMTVQFLYLVDTSFFVRLTESYYSSYAAAKEAMGYLTFNAQAIAGIPPILAIALSQSIIPVISAANSVRNMDEVQRQASLVMRIVVFTGVPAALILTVAAYSVNGLLFSSPAGSGMVAALTAGTIFQITMMTSNSILFGLGKPRPAMIHTLLGFAVKIAASLALAPLLGGYGLVLASTLCFLLITVLNLRVVRSSVKLAVLGKRWPAYLLTIVVTAGAGYGVDVLVRGALEGALPPKLIYLLGCMATGLVTLGLYALLLIMLRVVTETEAKSFPGPLRKLLLPLVRRLGRSRAASVKAD